MNYYDSTAKKISNPKRKVVKVKRVKRKVNSKPKKNNIILNILYIATIFAMLLVIAYRNNSISEKNIKSMELKHEVNVVNSNLASVKTDETKSIDLEYVEKYAKQQLGMQKPAKSQIVYIDTSSDNEIMKVENPNFFTEIINTVKKWF